MMEVGRWGEFLTVSRSPTETGTYSASEIRTRVLAT